jgi:hypothetical protein
MKCLKIRNLMPAPFTGLLFVISSSSLIKNAGGLNVHRGETLSGMVGLPL